MIKIRIRCKYCNTFECFEVKISNYFKWLISGNPNDLNLTDIDKLLFKSKMCNLCRIRRIK